MKKTTAATAEATLMMLHDDTLGIVDVDFSVYDSRGEVEMPKKLERHTVSGEGASAREALEALAFALQDWEVDEAGTLTIRVSAAKVASFGDKAAYDGYLAEVVR